MSALVFIPLLGLIWILFSISREAGLPLVLVGLIFASSVLVLLEPVLWMPGLVLLGCSFLILRHRQAGGWPLAYSVPRRDALALLVMAIALLTGWLGGLLGQAGAAFQLVELDAPQPDYGLTDLFARARTHLLVSVFILLAGLLFLVALIQALRPGAVDRQKG